MSPTARTSGRCSIFGRRVGAAAPLLFHIRGGGWVNGDKARVANLERYLDAGISVVSINYRFVTQAILAGVKPPVQWSLHDAARALQFVRSKSTEWNIDPVRIGASGGSAGACSSLWLAFHADLAEPKSSDPVARQSTRLWCAAVIGAQTTLDPRQMKEWTPNSRYGGHAFGFMPDPKNTKTRDTQFAQFLAARAQVLPWIKEYSPFEHVSADDPPVYLIYAAPPALGQEQKDPTHTANFGVKLQERLGEVGACELVYPGAPDETRAGPRLPDLKPNAKLTPSARARRASGWSPSAPGWSLAPITQRRHPPTWVISQTDGRCYKKATRGSPLSQIIQAEASGLFLLLTGSEFFLGEEAVVVLAELGEAVSLSRSLCAATYL